MSALSGCEKGHRGNVAITVSILRRMVSAGLLFVAGVMLAAAGPPETGLEGRGTKVSDEDLAQIRGKYIAPSGVSYFGLTLATSWQGADGITTMATVLFEVNFAGGSGDLNGATPRMLVGWNRDCDGCSDPAMDVPGFGAAAQSGYVAITPSSGADPVGGLGDVEGAVQSQIIGGSDNRVGNTMSIAFVPSSMIDGAQASGLTEIYVSKGITFADGDAIRFVLQPNEIALALSSGGNTDSVLQSVQGDPGQIAQHVILASDLNAISNTMGITIGLDQLRQMDSVSAEQAISAMHGNGF
jgi:hypothetical protein